MESDDKKHLKNILKTIIITLVVFLGCGWLPKSHQSPYNAFRGAIISNGYYSPSEYFNPLRTQNYTIIDSVVSSVNSTLFVSGETHASIVSEIDKYEILADRVIECESGGDHSKIGDQNYYVNGVWTPSRGQAQFQERTFNWLKGLANMDNLKYENPEHQRWLLKWALENGYSYLWSCWGKIDKTI